MRAIQVYLVLLLPPRPAESKWTFVWLHLHLIWGVTRNPKRERAEHVGNCETDEGAEPGRHGREAGVFKRVWVLSQQDHLQHSSCTGGNKQICFFEGKSRGQPFVVQRWKIILIKSSQRAEVGWGEGGLIQLGTVPQCSPHAVFFPRHAPHGYHLLSKCANNSKLKREWKFPKNRIKMFKNKCISLIFKKIVYIIYIYIICEYS